MTIPNVCMSWSRKVSTCIHCSEPIPVATAVVIVFYWNKGNPTNRRWNTKRYYHPQCWVDQATDYLVLHPYQAVGKRGPKPRIPEEVRRDRYLLLRRKAALEQRKRKLKMGYPDNILMVGRIDQQIVEITLDIASKGGIPPKWLKYLAEEEVDARG